MPLRQDEIQFIRGVVNEAVAPLMQRILELEGRVAKCHAPQARNAAVAAPPTEEVEVPKADAEPVVDKSMGDPKRVTKPTKTKK